MAGLDWCMPQAETPAAETPHTNDTDAAAAQTPAPPVAKRPVPTVHPIEINPARRRRDTDLIVEPGGDARAMARLLGQDVGDFIAIAITDHITRLRDKLRA